MQRHFVVRRLNLRQIHAIVLNHSIRSILAGLRWLVPDAFIPAGSPSVGADHRARHRAGSADQRTRTPGHRFRVAVRATDELRR